MNEMELEERRFAVADLVFRAEFREFCAENRCGKYGRHPRCPPACGTVEEMRARALRCSQGVVLRSHLAVAEHNRLAEEWIAAKVAAGELPANGELMSAGPTASASCLSAYCIDATALMETVGLPFSWAPDEASNLTLYLY